MRILYHLWMSPQCRKVRVALLEKRLEFDLRAENVWERRDEFLALNPASNIPVLVETDGTALSGSDAICEFLDEVHPEPPLIGHQPIARAEVRRLVHWFDEKFNAEVTENLVGEKMTKRYLGKGGPSSKAVRAGHANIHSHLDYIGYRARPTFRALIIWVTYRGPSTKRPRIGMRGSSPVRASVPFLRTISPVHRRKNITLILIFDDGCSPQSHPAGPTDRCRPLGIILGPV